MKLYGNNFQNQIHQTSKFTFCSCFTLRKSSLPWTKLRIYATPSAQRSKRSSLWGEWLTKTWTFICTLTKPSSLSQLLTNSWEWLPTSLHRVSMRSESKKASLSDNTSTNLCHSSSLKDTKNALKVGESGSPSLLTSTLCLSSCLLTPPSSVLPATLPSKYSQIPIALKYMEC